MEKNEKIINAESEKGWWDITFEEDGVNIAKFSDDQMEMELGVTNAEWKDLCQLIIRLNQLT